MANEVRVFEQQTLRGNIQIRTAPFLEQQVLSIGGAVSAGFSLSTSLITVVTSVACSVDIGTAPTGAVVKFPLAANQPYDFSVIPGHKIIVVA